MAPSPRSVAARSGPFERLARDRTHGAYPLARTALVALGRATSKVERVDPRVLRRWASAVRRAQPALGTVVGIAEGLEELARAGPGRRTPGQMRGWIAARRRRLAREEREVLRRARRAFPPGAAVVTLSASSLVARLLGGFRAERRPSRVIVLASRPGGEGVSLARTLQRRQVPTRLIPDREGPRAVRGTTVLLVGADTIYADGSLLHKVGTRRMAEAAFRANVPVVSLSGSSKFLRRRPPRRLPGGGWFDLTPPRWVSAYWTERGALRPDQVGARLGGLSPDRRRTR